MAIAARSLVFEAPRGSGQEVQRRAGGVQHGRGVGQLPRQCGAAPAPAVGEQQPADDVQRGGHVPSTGRSSAGSARRSAVARPAARMASSASTLV